MPTPDATGPTLLIAAAACGPMASTEIVLLGKPLGGATGLPGAVVGYIAATAVVLAVLSVPLTARWNLLRTGKRCGVAALVAGAAAVIAGAVPSAAALCAGILVLGALAGPLLAAVRTTTGVRPFYAVASVAAAAGAAVARLGFEHPGIAVVIPGLLAVLAGSLPALRRSPSGRPEPAASIPKQLPAATETAAGGNRVADDSLTPGDTIAAGRSAADERFTPGDTTAAGEGVAGEKVATGDTIAAGGGKLGRWGWSVYAAIGFAVGGTVLPALHLLLFRWNVLDSRQGSYLAVAVVPAVLAAAIAGYRANALASLLILLAGGPVLVATAPGAWQLTLGVAVTVTVAIRCLATADSLLRQPVPAAGSGRWATTSGVVLGCAALVGLGCSAALAAWWGTGSALTLLALPILAAAVLTSRSASPGEWSHPTAAVTATIEGAVR